MLAAGNLLHFVYDWTGQSPVAGALAAVNESVWEHMKLLTTPWVLWSIAELVAVGRSGLPVTAARAAGLLAGLAPILEELSGQHPELKIVKVDVDENRELALRYGIESIPTLLVFKGGQVADRSVGLVSPQEILALVK